MQWADDVQPTNTIVQNVLDYLDNAVVTMELIQPMVDVCLADAIDLTINLTNRRHLRQIELYQHREFHDSNELNTVPPEWQRMLERENGIFRHRTYFFWIVEITLLMNIMSIDQTQIVRLFDTILVDTIGWVLSKKYKGGKKMFNRVSRKSAQLNVPYNH